MSHFRAILITSTADLRNAVPTLLHISFLLLHVMVCGISKEVLALLPLEHGFVCVCGWVYVSVCGCEYGFISAVEAHLL